MAPSITSTWAFQLGDTHVSSIHRISYVNSNQPPVAAASANPTAGPTPLTVTFSSAGSSDPGGAATDLFVEFGDGKLRPPPNPRNIPTLLLARTRLG